MNLSRSHNSYTPDVLTLMKDAGAVTATGRAQVGGANRTLDFGNTTSGPAVEQVAYTPGRLFIEVTAIDFTTGDETYQVVVFLSDNASAGGTGFAAGDVVVVKCVPLVLGNTDTSHAVTGVNTDDNVALGQYSIGIDNEAFATLFRFMCLGHILGGTTPSLNYQAWFVRNG